MFLAEKVEAEVHFCLLHWLPRKRDSVKRSTLSHPSEHQQKSYGWTAEQNLH